MSGPSGHPGVSLTPLTGNALEDQAVLEAALTAEKDINLKGFYTAGGNTFAVFTHGYKQS